MLSLKQDKKEMRGVLLGLVVAGLLVALVVIGSEEKKERNLTRKMNVIGAQKMTGCSDKLLDILQKSDPRSSSFWHDFGTTSDAVVGYTDARGESHVVPFSSANADAALLASGLSRRTIAHELMQKHKNLDNYDGLSSSRAFLWQNNMAVTVRADENACGVSGLYLPGVSASLHPAVHGDILLAQDKDTPCRTSYGRCTKDGAYCAKKADESCGRTSCSKSLSCPSGWYKSGDYFACEGTSCDSRCSLDNCGNVGSFGQCTLGTNCDFSHLDQKISDTSTTVGNVVTAIQTGATLASLIPSPGDTIVGFLSSAIGFANNAGMTAETAYNELMQELARTVDQMITCVDEKIMSTNIVDLRTDMNSISSDLRIVAFTTTTQADRSRTLGENRVRCTDIGSRFQAIVDSSQPLVTVDRVFPYAMEATELCALNYLATIVDKKKLGESTSTVKEQYKVMMTNVYEAVKKMITWLDEYHRTKDKCNYFNSDRNELNNYISTLRTQYETPLAELRNSVATGNSNTPPLAKVVLDEALDGDEKALAFAAGLNAEDKKTVGYSRGAGESWTRVRTEADARTKKVDVLLLGDDSVMKMEHSGVVNADAVAQEKVMVPNTLSCLALVRLNARYVAADALHMDGKGVLCRLYTRASRNAFKLMVEREMDSTHFDFARVW